MSVAAHAQGSRIRVEVTDNGTGIAEAAIPHVFDRFYSESHGENGHSTELDSPSHGLGLAIVKRIMELHHSTVTVTSSPHKETVFSFWLPVPEEKLLSA